MLASESVALDMLGYRVVPIVAPGEAVFIDELVACMLSSACR